jgi:L-iditol 2-dehydrogenase
MKTVRLHAAGDLRLHEEEVPQPGPEEVLLRISAVGICASDLHWFCEGGIGDARLARPLVLGHEFSAQVEALGANVTGFTPGQRMVVDPNIPCHKCEFCLAGHPNLCPHCRFAGHGLEDGALREYMIWPAECLFALPDTLSDAEGAALEPMGVALHAVNLSHLKPGMSVGIFGCGPIGLMILQLARASGATQIIATDPLPPPQAGA